MLKPVKPVRSDQAEEKIHPWFFAALEQPVNTPEPSVRGRSQDSREQQHFILIQRKAVLQHRKCRQTVRIGVLKDQILHLQKRICQGLKRLKLCLIRLK